MLLMNQRDWLISVSCLLAPCNTYTKPSPESFQEGGFMFVQGGLTFRSLIKIPPIYSGSKVNLGGLEFFWGGCPKIPAYRRDCIYTDKTLASLRSLLQFVTVFLQMC